MRCAGNSFVSKITFLEVRVAQASTLDARVRPFRRTSLPLQRLAVTIATCVLHADRPSRGTVSLVPRRGNHKSWQRRCMGPVP